MNKSELTLDIEGLRMVAGYAHWIPGIRGLYKDYFARNLPGWQWNQIIPFLIKKRVVVCKEIPGYLRLSQGLYIASDIESFSLWMKNCEIQIAVTRKDNQQSFEE
jgi:hypothetical protein